MTDPLAYYPKSPDVIPEQLIAIKPGHRWHAWFAMLSLMAFLALYFVLMVSFAVITWQGLQAIFQGQMGFLNVFVTSIAVLLTLFMLKPFFTMPTKAEPTGIEVTAEDEPELFQFLYQLADEIGAPKPHRVFITPEVNAAVFYDLSWVNLIFPSKKNLIIGLGLVNTLTLTELKAVLAHEFGHFAQSSMMIGRWVYVAQQIISRMLTTRDWLDQFIRFLSRVDLRVAWLGWCLGLIVWSIRSLIDTLFRLVVLAERALSREMEFNADLVSVSVAGSDALIDALYKLQAADEAWQTALSVAQVEASRGLRVTDLWDAQTYSAQEIRRVMNAPDYGLTPERPAEVKPEDFRVFAEEYASPPLMWASHPANRDREENAKTQYIESIQDDREAWMVFSDPETLRYNLSLKLYSEEQATSLKEVQAFEAVSTLFDRQSYSPQYRGTYLNRSVVRYFSNVETMLASSDYITVDDTGARHKGKNGYVTQVGNDTFAWFESTGSKSRINFLQLLRAGEQSYQVNEPALEYMKKQGLPRHHLERLMKNKCLYFKDALTWEEHLKCIA